MRRRDDPPAQHEESLDSWNFRPASLASWEDCRGRLLALASQPCCASVLGLFDFRTPLRLLDRQKLPKETNASLLRRPLPFGCCLLSKSSWLWMPHTAFTFSPSPLVFHEVKHAPDGSAILRRQMSGRLGYGTISGACQGAAYPMDHFLGLSAPVTTRPVLLRLWRGTKEEEPAS